ncbi:phage major capsid protein [Shinella zoogloeoides]|uniref:phage major capsid protein n=1 Tax=Shinella zoogloeoides TaxID=352475 RepID=UPI00299D9322|nr:phage major capsid protein [Shinella zoogloeoides]WPE19953.1 hypothetical protein ShzoTeo12_11330 [Shinella zoogloeoides]
MNMAQLRARLKELNGELSVLIQKDAPTAEDMAAIEQKLAEIEGVEKDINTLERATAAQARASQPANAPAGTEERTVPAQVKKNLSAAEKVGTLVFSMAKAHKMYGKGTEHVFKTMEDAGYAAVAEEFTTARALNSSAAASGGVLVPEDMSSEIIDLLRPRTTFLRGNPRNVSLVSGSYKLPAAAAGATAQWRGEGDAIQASQPSFKDINLVAKFLDSLVPLTNQLIRWSLADVRSWVERDMSLAMGVALDGAAYFGPGTVHSPLGITRIPGVHRVGALGGTAPSIAEIEGTARGLELSMENKDLIMNSTAWVMAPRTLRFLSDLRGNNDQLLYPTLQGENPVWRGRPVFKTTQVKINGGASTDESELLLVNFDDIYFGEGAGISFAVSTEATYVKNGKTISAFQNDLTLIKASMEADVDVAYTEAVAVAEKVRWGA